MAIKVYKGGAWVTVAENNGISETYTLPLTGATGAVGLGSARWTLDASAGTDTSVTLYPGNNINISSIDVTGDNRSFTIASTDTTYELPLLATPGSNGVGVATFTLTSSDNVEDPITIKAGANITIGSINETNGEFTISASGGTQASPVGPTYAVQYNAGNSAFGGTQNFTYDGLYNVAFLGVGGTMHWDGTQRALEFSDDAEATFGKSKDLQIYHSSGVSYIDEVIGNDLIIRGKTSGSTWNTSNKIEINPESGRESIVAIANSTVQLYDAGYDGQYYHGKVLQTNPRGIGVFNTNTSKGGELSLFESVGSGFNNQYVSIACTNVLGSSYTLVLPDDAGNPNQVLTTDGNGLLTWTAKGSSSGGTPGGPDHAIQFNDNSTFNGNANFTYDGATIKVGSGITMDATAGIVTFVDASGSGTATSNALHFGASGDLQIYHQSESFIDETNGNDLYIRGKSGNPDPVTGTGYHKIWISPRADKESIVAIANSTVQLYDSTGGHGIVFETNNRGIGVHHLDGASGAQLTLFEGFGSTSNPRRYVSIAAPNALTGVAYTLTLPHNAGANNQVLTTDGAGTLSWSAKGSGGGGGSPATPLNSFQFNDNSSFGGASAFTYDKTNRNLILSGTAVGVTSAYWNASDNSFNFIDDAEAKFGTDNDLKIYHDPTNNTSVIRHDNTASNSGLYLQSNRRFEITSVNPFKLGLRFNNSGTNYETELYYDDDKKFETFSQGIIVHSDSGGGGRIRLTEASSNAGDQHYVEIKSPDTVGAAYTLTLPANDGNPNQVLSTDGTGLLSWVANSGSGGASYTLPLTATSGGSGVGIATWTLDASSGTDTSITLNAGNNINISNINTGTNDDSFTLSATNTTYLLKCTKDSNGGSTGTDTDPYLFLDASGTGTDDSVKIVGTGNVTVTRDDDGQLTINGSGSSGSTTFTGLTDTPGSYSSQGGKLVAVKVDLTGTQKLEFIDKTTYDLEGGGTNGTSGGWATGIGSIFLYKDSGADPQDTVSITAGANIRIDGTSASGFTITANGGSGGSGTTYDFAVIENLPELRLSGSDGTNDDVEFVGTGGISVTGIGTTSIKIDGSSITGINYTLPLLATQGSNGVGVATFSLTDVSGGTSDPITIKAGANITIGSINETNGEFTISASGSGGSGPTYTLPTTQNTSSDPVYLTLTPSTGSVSDAQKVAIRGSSTISVSESPIGNVGGFIINTTAAANTTYDLLGGGTDGASFGTGIGSVILRPTGTTNSDDEVTITAGSNIKIDNTGTGGFTISANNTQSSWTLATNIADVLNFNGAVLSADDAGQDGIVYWDESATELTHFKVGTNNAGKVLRVDSNGTSLEWGTVSGTGVGNTYEIPVYGNSNGLSGIRLLKNDVQTDTISIFGQGGITVIGNDYAGINTGTVLMIDGGNVGKGVYVYDETTNYGLATSFKFVGNGVVVTGTDDEKTVTIDGNVGFDTYVTSMTLSGQTLTLNRNGALSGTPLSVDLTPAISGIDTYVNSATLDSTTKVLSLGRTGALSPVTVDLSSLSGGGNVGFDTYVTSATLDPSTKILSLGRNGALSATDVTVDLSGLTGIATDKIIEGDTKVEVVDPGVGINTYITGVIDGVEAFRFNYNREMIIRPAGNTISNVGTGNTGDGEGGHIQFASPNGTLTYAIDTYGNRTDAWNVLRLIDQTNGGGNRQRFCMNRYGAIGIGHMSNVNGDADYGSTGKVLTSQGPYAQPTWSSLSGQSAIETQSEIRNSDYTSSTQNAWLTALDVPITRTAGTKLIVMAKINYQWSFFDDDSENGTQYIQMRLVKKQGNNAYQSIGEPITLDNNTIVDPVSGDEGHRNSFAGQDYIDPNNISGSYTYAVQYKWYDVGNNTDTDPKIRQGSSLTLMQI